ncbi:cupredoxin domain-containing protein [Cohnella mopanensis]|uniref:cupredoxin domain-containing protein n=1 Tax=Cohnella mopanensis TaxID=2911966 RepID=UPI001EF7F125|nr:cupredoxin domain-containing protein [Cohnella mopanensis]
MKLKPSLFFTVALAAIFALSACGSNNANNNNLSPSPSASISPPASSQAAGGATKEVTITATNWKFDQTEIKAKVGDTLKLTLKNTQGAHGLAIQDMNVNIKNNETAEIKLDKAGTYEYHCSIQCGQGHDNMVGQLIVE